MSFIKAAFKAKLRVAETALASESGLDFVIDMQTSIVRDGSHYTPELIGISAAKNVFACS